LRQARLSGNPRRRLACRLSRRPAHKRSTHSRRRKDRQDTSYRQYAGLEQPELFEFAAHFFRHLVIRLATLHIGGRVFRIEIAPSLKGASFLPPRRHDLMIENETAAPDPLAIRELLNTDEPLAAADDTLHHPIKRTTVQQFIRALRRHARYMGKHLRLTPTLHLGKPLGLPSGKVCNIISANAELDEMNRQSDASSKETSTAPAST